MPRRSSSTAFATEPETPVPMMALPETQPPRPTVTIGPKRYSWDLGLKDVWESRDLLYFFVWRDIKVRYKQTVLGAGWAILQPVLATLVFSIFFGRLAKVPSDGFYYPVFAYVGFVPWQFFASAVASSSNSLVGNQSLLQKVYFPRLTVPLAPIFAGLVDFCIAFVVLVVMMFYFHVVPHGSVVLLPVFLLLAVATAFAAGLWLSALNVQFRDVRYTVPFLLQFWMFATPVVYPSTLVPRELRVWYGLNPMAGVVEGFRVALLGRGHPGPMIWVSAVVVVIMLVGGLLYFRHVESTFADIV